MIRVVESVTHQEIGGHEFIIDENITATLYPAEIYRLADSGNWACRNFIERRPDFNHDFEPKLYYGKVKKTDSDHEILLGYIVAEDELIFE